MPRAAVAFLSFIASSRATRLAHALASSLAAGPAPSTTLTLTAPDSTTTSATAAIAAFAFANASYSTAATSFALWGGRNFAAYAWGSHPPYIASYSCQGPQISEKLLALGGAREAALVATWLLTLPLSQAGKAWEAGNAEWHVAHQGTWESSAESLIMMRQLAAHGEAALVARAAERLVCASGDGGATWALAGVPQPGLADAVCATAPSALAPGGTPPLPPPPPPAPFFFTDAPSLPFNGSTPGLENAGRLLTAALRTATPVTHFALPLVSKARGGAGGWAARVTVTDAATGAVVGEADVPAARLGDAWTRIAVGAPGAPGALAPPGVYVISLALADSPPAGGASKDSWFLSASWVGNARPASGGGAGAATWGASTHWLRNASAPPDAPRLAHGATLTAAAALAGEVARVRVAAGSNTAAAAHAAALGADAPLGRSIADMAALALSFVLALSSQVPLRGAGAGGGGGYDVFVVPDARFRGTFEDGVNSGCSYYDLLRIGFASSYLNARALEGVLAYGELQAAGLAPSACPGGSSLGRDNADALSGALPCYTAADVTAAAGALRAAMAARFVDAAGRVVDWWGCASMADTGGDVGACGLQDVAGGAAPPTSLLLRVATDFLPSIALFAKLGVGQRGAALAELARARAAAAAPAPYYGGFWLHTALLPLEDVAGGARSTIAQETWRATDAAGFAVREMPPAQRGDWHMFNASEMASGRAPGYGNYAAQAENGGRFFTTTAFVWEALNSPLAGDSWAPPGADDVVAADFARLVGALDGVGAQLAAGDTSEPLLARDRGFLSAPSADATVRALCEAARASFPNVTDAWGDRLCSYYQDLGWGTPENGVVFFSFVKALVGVHAAADGSLFVFGARSPPWTSGAAPWRTAAPRPAIWPRAVAALALRGMQVRGLELNVECAAGASEVTCDVTVAAGVA